MSRIWYKAQILPLPNVWAVKIEHEIRTFLWKSQPMKNLLSLDTVCLNKSKGGLGLPYLRSRCNALLLKQALRIITSSKNIKDHLGFWFGEALGLFGFDLKFQHFSLNKNGNRRLYKPKFFRSSCKLLLEGLEKGMFSLSTLHDTPTKSLYLSLTESLPPPSVEVQYPDRDWKRTWKRINSGVLAASARDFLFLIIHERLFTRERGHKYMPKIVETPFCIRCLNNEVESILHRYTSCEMVLEGWNCLKEIIESIDITMVFESDHSLLNLYYQEPTQGSSVLWLLGVYIDYTGKEVILNNRRITRSKLIIHIKAK